MRDEEKTREQLLMELALLRQRLTAYEEKEKTRVIEPEQLKIAEKELKESEQIYRCLFENSLDGMLLASPDGTYLLDANIVACQMFGRAKEEICAIGRSDLVDISDPKVKHGLEERANTGRFHDEITMIRKDGSTFEAEISSSLFKTVGGHTLASIIIRDISERKQMEEKLRYSEDKFCKAFDHSPVPSIIVKKKDSRLTEVNNAWLQLMGFSRKEVIGHTLKELDFWINAEDRPLFLQQLGKGDALVNLEQKFKTKNGDHRICMASVGMIELEGELHNIATMVDVTEHRQAVEALKQSEERFFKAFHNSPAMMLISRLEDGVYIDVNQTYLDKLGYSREELIGHSSIDLDIWVTPQDRNELTQRIEAEGQIPFIEVENRTKSGEILQLISSMDIIEANKQRCLIAILVDVTGLKRMEKEINHMDRLNLIGQMAASICHEIRNPMTAVRGFLQMLGQQDRFAEEEEVFTLMIEELDRANGILSNYLSLAGDKPFEMRPTSLNWILQNIYPIVLSDALIADKNVLLMLNEVPLLALDEKEIRQLILNLARNGLEAMHTGGLLTIRTGRENGEVLLEVEDQGAGLSCEQLESLGTPFQTTKSNGTGLGLPVCYSIAHRHNAKIEVETGAAGTKFKVRFALQR